MLVLVSLPLLLLVQLASALVPIPTRPTTSLPTPIHSTPRHRVPCSDGTLLRHANGATCIKAFHKTKLSWTDARSTCQRLGGDLVQIRSLETNDLVGHLLTRRVRYWTGMTYSDDRFEYLNGQPMTSFQPWAVGEPNNKGGNEQCVEIIGNEKGAWNDKRCSKKRSFVCEIPTTLTSPTPVTSQTPSVGTRVPTSTSHIPPVTSPIPPVTPSIPPVTSPIPPVTSPIPPVASPIPPATSPIPPTTSPIPPATTPIPPTTESVTVTR